MTDGDFGASRRGLLRAAAAGAAAAALAQTGARAATTARPVKAPPGFLFGAATAGHQVEGNNLNSDIWFLEHLPQTPFAETSGDACDQYHLYRDDIALLASLGLNSYRFSLEWARIEPEPGEFSRAELEHYRRVAATCREHGVTPVVTYNHYTVPKWFAAQGGFETPQSVDRFARFCERSTAALGDLVGLAGVFNEPNIGLILSHIVPPQIMAQFPALMQEAAKAYGSQRWSTVQFGDQGAMLPNMIAAYEKAYGVIKAGLGDVPVGLSLAIFDDQAVGKDSMRDRKRADFYGPWLEAVKRTGDFIGVQTYTRKRWDAKGEVPPPAGARINQMHEEFYPEAIEGSIRYAHAATGKPVYVTENGCATENDAWRVEYIQRALASVQRCLAGGVPVKSYIHWSLLDNFEWVSGYGPKFGLVAVDRATQKRTPKPSASYLGNLAKAGRLV